MNHCKCGNLQRKHITDSEVCLAYAIRKSLRRANPDFSLSPHDMLMYWNPGASFKVCWRAMERAFSRGLIDYGGNLSGGWLTEKGESLANSEEHIATEIFNRVFGTRETSE